MRGKGVYLGLSLDLSTHSRSPGTRSTSASLVRYHVQVALAGDTDDEYGWEHIDVGINSDDDGDDDDDDDDDDDEMNLAEI